MKAWLVRDKYESCSAAVVFAETRGQAKAAAKSTDACEDSDFCDIEARRLPQIDKYYKDGKWEMDWNNYEDRIALVTVAGFVCDPDYWVSDDCAECPAMEFCSQAQEQKEV